MVVRGFLVMSMLIAVGMGAARTASAQEEPNFMTIGAGVFGLLREDTRAGGLDFAYRGRPLIWYLKPHAGVLATSDGGAYGYAGLLIDIFFGRRWVLTPSTAVGFYHEGDGPDLGGHLHFRSGAEIAWRFDNRARLGIGFYHLSNASLDEHNPGAELLLLNYSLPVGSLVAR